MQGELSLFYNLLYLQSALVLIEPEVYVAVVIQQLLLFSFFLHNTF